MSLRKHLRRIVVVLIVILLGSSAETLAQTLDKVRNSGKITVGYFEFQVPLSYVDSSRRPIGYQLDICHQIIAATKAKVGLSNLEVRYVSLTEASSVPSLANGTVDLVCAGRAHTEDREQYAAFTDTTFLSRFTILSRKDVAYQTISDLKGKKVVFSAGTLTSKRLTELDFREGLGMTLIPAKNQTEAFKIFEMGEADGYVSTETTLASLIARSSKGGDYFISPTALWNVPFAIMLRKDDPQFKQLADAAIADLFKSGQIREIYQRWFEQAIPPNGIILHIAANKQIEKLFAHPTDSPRLVDYE